MNVVKFGRKQIINRLKYGEKIIIRISMEVYNFYGGDDIDEWFECF